MGAYATVLAVRLLELESISSTPTPKRNNRYEHERNCHRYRADPDQSLRTLKVLLRWKVNNEVSDHGNRFSVTHTR